MTHGRKPRKPRAVDPFTFGTALHKAARLTHAEVATTIAPLITSAVKAAVEVVA